MLIILATIFFIEIFPSDTTITFRQIKYSDVFETAKKENKGIMLYFHFEGCSSCLAIEKTVFKDKTVIDYLNSNFVNYSIDTKKGEGIEINKIYQIKMHPTFVFFDRDGNEIHKLAGVYKPDEFYKKVHNAFVENKNLTNFRNKYNSGLRDAEFLFEYIYMLRDAYELNKNVVDEYFDLINEEEFKLEKNIKLIYEFCVYNFNIFIPFKSRVFDFILNNKELFYNYLDSNQVKTRIVWILDNAIKKAIEEKDSNTFEQAIEKLKEFDTGDTYIFKEIDGRITGIITDKNLVLSYSLDFHRKVGDDSKYLKTLDEYAQKIWNDSDELNSLAKKIYKYSGDNEKEKILKAIECSVRSIELNNSYENNDNYARLLYKLGDLEKAAVQANKAIELAKQSNEDYSLTEKLLDEIQKSYKK